MPQQLDEHGKVGGNAFEPELAERAAGPGQSGLDTIAGLGSSGNSKSAVLQKLFGTTSRNSVLGTYGFDKNGDTTLTKYGVYGVGKDGNPTFQKAVG